MAKASTKGAGKAGRYAHFIVQEKGGAGKSFVAAALLGFMRGRGLKVAAYDADKANATFTTMCATKDGEGRRSSDPLRSVALYSLSDDEQRRMLVTTLDCTTPHVLHDLPGRALEEMTKIVDQGEGVRDLIALIDSLDRKLVLWHVLSPKRSAAASVANYIRLFGDNALHVAVVNTGFGKRAAFPWWYGHPTRDAGGKARAQLLSDEIGGIEIEFPALDAGTFALIEADELTFEKAETATADYDVVERAHIKTFRRKVEEVLLAHAEQIGV